MKGELSWVVREQKPRLWEPRQEELIVKDEKNCCFLVDATHALDKDNRRMHSLMLQPTVRQVSEYRPLSLQAQKGPVEEEGLGVLRCVTRAGVQ